MIIVALHKWSLLILVNMAMAEPQFQMPYAPIVFPPPPPQPVPVGVPMPVPMPFPVGIRIEEEEKVTTTTKKPQRALKMFMQWAPFPFQVQALKQVTISSASNGTNRIHIPLGAQGFAMPFPIPMAAAPPIIMLHSPRIRSSSTSLDSASSSLSTSSDDSDSDSESSRVIKRTRRKRKKRRKNKKRKNRHGIFRRNLPFFSDASSSDEELEPLLNYVSRNGDVKLSRRLSKRDAALLINDERKPRPVQKVEFVVGNDSNDKSRVKVIAGSAKSTDNLKEEIKKIILRRSSQQLVSGNKELVFRPPGNKKISNFSMSFNVAK